jgi:hypothetical protein
MPRRDAAKGDQLTRGSKKTPRSKALAPLSPTLVESLFERGVPLYGSESDELAAVARGDKGNCNTEIDPNDAPRLSAFLRNAEEHGLVVSQRHRRSGDHDVLELCATRLGEEWQAKVIAWVTEGGVRYGRSERATYYQSRILGYTHEQSVAWIEMCRHQTPLHNCMAVFLFLSTADARRCSDANGELKAVDAFAYALPMLYYGGLRRDALKRLPAGFAIGRAAFEQGAFQTFFTYEPNEPNRVLIGVWTPQTCTQLARSLLSPIDFWDGTRWFPQPVMSGSTSQ